MTNVTDEILGKIARQQHDLFRRVREGALDSITVSAGLQAIIEGKFPAVPPNPSTDLTPVSQYTHKLHDWNDRFELGLTAEQIAYVTSALPDHAGLLLPTGISLTLGKGLQHDWTVAMQVLRYELQKLGVPFTEYFDASRLTYFPGCGPTEPDAIELDVVLLDFQTFWDSPNGIVPREVRKQLKGRPLPGLEVVWFLALNPQVFLAMDGRDMPYLWVAGLVVDSDYLPCFCRDSDEAFVGDDWDDSQWNDSSVVVFREC